ncbi:MAG: hypothetical protein OSJ58_18615 [Dysosmobacter sp.]|nr:hypothetical protein [Dysosmobacter sp.]
MGQYYYIPDPGEQQRGGYAPAIPDRLAQLRQNQVQPMMQGPQMGQNQMQQIPPANPAAGCAQNGIIWISGKAEADGYLVAPNSAVALWDANNPVIYLRKADSTGKPSTVVYDLVERTDNPGPQQSAPQIDMSQYVTLEQLEAILAERLKKPAKPAKLKEDTDNG